MVLKVLTDPEYLKFIRPIVQGLFFLFSLYIGYEFYLFYSWAIGSSVAFSPRPPGVEAFLPISALLGLKRFILTGKYDMVHPAGLTILLAVLTISFFFRKAFCGWICPVGFVSNLVERLGRSFRLSISVRPWVRLILMVPKYLLMAFFIYVIFIKMDLRAIESFINSPYNISVDAKMLLFFMAPSSATLWVISGIIVVSLFIVNFWCRYLCPYGALLGLFAMVGPLRIVRDEEECIGCKRCRKVCPSGISVDERRIVWDPDCIGCEECISVCPKKECLSVRFYSRPISPFILPALAVGTFLLFWLVARATGYWESSVPLDVFSRFYSMVNAFKHPAY